jgi:hypothetical protein
MPRIKIVTKKEGRHAAEADMPAGIALPTNYMADYSVMGLQVDDLAKAIGILRDNGIQVKPRAHSAELTFTGQPPLPQVLALLKAQGLNGCLTDLVNQVYQG